MRYGSLFSGIGGMDLGLDRAGMTCAWQVEIDPYARRVLEKHWPNVRKHDDVRTFPPRDGEWGVDLIAGGFPCQDISISGRGAGISGIRSGLWDEFKRILCLLRPKYALIENSPAIAFRGLDRVLCDLASLGFNAEWSTLSACSMGAPHTRERMFILGYTDGIRLHGWPASESESQSSHRCKNRVWIGSHEPEFCRATPRLPRRMDRVRTLGNAVVPQVSEWIGRRILEAMAG